MKYTSSFIRVLLFSAIVSFSITACNQDSTITNTMNQAETVGDLIATAKSKSSSTTYEGNIRYLAEDLSAYDYKNCLFEIDSAPDFLPNTTSYRDLTFGAPSSLIVCDSANLAAYGLSNPETDILTDHITLPAPAASVELQMYVAPNRPATGLIGYDQNGNEVARNLLTEEGWKMPVIRTDYYSNIRIYSIDIISTEYPTRIAVLDVNYQKPFYDNQAPEINYTQVTNSLFPANNKMKLVLSEIKATDDQDPAADVTVEVSSNEKTKGKKPIYEIEKTVKGLNVYLRASRNGNGSGRKYMVQLTSTDSEGLTARKFISVDVPHDRGNHGIKKVGKKK